MTQDNNLNSRQEKAVWYNEKEYQQTGGMPSDLMRVVAEAADRILEADRILASYGIDNVWVHNPVFMLEDQPIVELELEESFVIVNFLTQVRDE